MTSKESAIQYISDPMCPWCFAFTPVFDRIKEEFENNFRYTYIAGGLRLRPDEPPMDEEFKDMLCGYWETVEMETGQKFDIDLVNNMNFAFNTEPACRAMVTFRHLYPEQLFDFEKQLQKGTDKTVLMKGYTEHKILSKSLNEFLSDSRESENRNSGPACELGKSC